jgi:hypothetical protein
MYKIAFVNGGAGRMICSIPALEKFILKNPENYVITEGGLDFVWGNKILQDRTFDSNTKGIFESVIRNGEIISVEPYREHEYYNQKIGIAQAIDKIINGSYESIEKYKVKLTLNKEEEITALAVTTEAKKVQGKKKTVLIQPFGRGVVNDENLNITYDHGSRSMENDFYLKLATEIKKKYNVISMSEFQIPGDDITMSPKNLTLRKWAAVIEQIDYFVGCDSVGQHFSYGYDKPGTVICGSTFPINVSYPNHFNIIEKKGFERRYDPIRICEFGSYEASRLNDVAMSFNENESKEIIHKIMIHIKSKIGE